MSIESSRNPALFTTRREEITKFVMRNLEFLNCKLLTHSTKFVLLINIQGSYRNEPLPASDYQTTNGLEIFMLLGEYLRELKTKEIREKNKNA